MNLSQKLPLRHQLTLVSLLPVVFLGVLATLVSIYALRRTALDLVLQRNMALVQVAAAGVAEELDGRLRLLQVTADELAPHAADPHRQAEMLATRSPFLDLFEGGVLLLDRVGVATASTAGHEERVGRNYGFRDYFQSAKQDLQPVFSAVLQELPSGRDAVVIAVPLSDGSRFDGALLGIYFLEQYPWADDLQPLRTPQGAQVSLIDGQGIVISHADPVQIGRSVTGDAVLGELVAGGELQSRLYESATLGEQAVVSYAPLPGVGWGLLMEEPWRPIIAPALPYQWAVGVLLGIGFSISLLMLLFSIKRVSRPLVALWQAARRVAGGMQFQPLRVEGAPEVRTLIVAFNQMVVRLAEQQATLRNYAWQVLHGQEEERKRISRDLHDQVVQDLVGVVQRVELCHLALQQDPKLACARITELETLARGTLSDVRRLSNDLRPLILEDLGLIEAVSALCDDLQTALPAAELQFEVVGEVQRLAPEVELTVYRVIQESLTNIRKHARTAGRVHVMLRFEPGRIRVGISDDGPGFDMPSYSDLIRQGHLGLTGMAERAQLFDGTLQVRTAHHQVTALELDLPVQAPEAVTAAPK